MTQVHSEPVWSQNLQFLVTVTRHYDLTVKNTHRHQRVVIAVMQATLAMGKQSERLNKAAQQRKKSNSIADIYNEIVFSPLLCRLTHKRLRFSMSKHLLCESTKRQCLHDGRFLKEKLWDHGEWLSLLTLLVLYELRFAIT